MRMEKGFKTNLLVMILTGVVVFALDRMTKIWAMNNLLEYIPRVYMRSPVVVRLVLVKNSGVMLGFFSGNDVVRVLASFVGLGVLAYVIYGEIRKSLWYAFLLGLVLGGAVGNVYERVVLGKVVDFIQIGRMPVFNLADAAITFSVLAFMISYSFESLVEGAKNRGRAKGRGRVDRDEGSGSGKQ